MIGFEIAVPKLDSSVMTVQFGLDKGLSKFAQIQRNFCVLWIFAGLIRICNLPPNFQLQPA